MTAGWSPPFERLRVSPSGCLPWGDSSCVDCGTYDSRPILTQEHLDRSCGYVLRNATRHGLVDRAEDWEWSSFRTVARLDPPPRPHLVCKPFERMLGLGAGVERLAVMRAYVREPVGETVMIAA